MSRPGRTRPAVLGDGLVERRLRVHASEVARVKAFLEASEGVAIVFGEQGGDLVVAAPADRAEELDALLADLPRFLARFATAT